MLAAFATTVFFSLSAVCGQRASRLLGGTAANFWRLCFGALVLGLYAHALGGGLAGAAFPVFLVSGIIGFGIGDVAFYQALPRLGSRLSILLVMCLSSPLGGWVEWLWLGTTLSAGEMIGGGVILAGVALALSPGRRLEVSSPQWIPGLLFGGVASVCQAMGAVLSRKGFAVASAAGESLDGITAAYQRILGGLAIGTLVWLVVKGRTRAPTPQADDATPGNLDRAAQPAPRSQAVFWVVLNALSGSVLGVSCFQWALKTTQAGVVLPIVAITPLVIIPFSRYIEGEQPTRRSLLGGAVAVAGAVALALSR
jgi:drug/metabolite transporter (DMT)-like permease